MTSILKRIYKSTLGIYERKDLSSWSHTPACSTPIYGIYHIFCDANWKEMVREQMQHLADSGLLEASNRLYISCIARNNEDIMELVDILRQYSEDKIEFVSKTTNPQRFEFPALDYMYEKSQHEDFLFYYFHTKGITYQTTLHQEDREFKGFVDKIVAWRRMMEYFLMNQWKVAVNTLEAGYDTYGSYLFPPFKNRMYAGNFWWAKASYFRTLPALDEDTKLHNRFMAEEWLLSLPGVRLSQLSIRWQTYILSGFRQPFMRSADIPFGIPSNTAPSIPIENISANGSVTAISSTANKNSSNSSNRFSCWNFPFITGS